MLESAPKPPRARERSPRDPEALRRRLLDAAQRLFFDRGYDGTSVEDVIRATDSSKGAFYHHFASKEALLEALAARLADENVTEAATVLEVPGIGAVEQLAAFLAGSRRLKIAAAPLVRRTLPVLFRPENASLRQRVTAATIARVAPVLAQIIERGRQEGVFDTPDPLGTAELLLHLGTAVHDTIARALAAADAGAPDRAREMLDRRLALVEQAFNRVLALPDGTLSLTEPGFAAAVIRVKPSVS